jgi:hypothetical protein
VLDIMTLVMSVNETVVIFGSFVITKVITRVNGGRSDYLWHFLK